MVKERVSEVSQSGLTQEEPALLVLVGLEFEVEFFSVEDLMVRKCEVDLEEEREVDLVVGLRRGFGRREKVESEREEGIVVTGE